MRALFVSTYDSHGGAARASFRLLQGLGAAGLDVQMCVKIKGSDDPRIISLPPKKWSQVQKRIFHLKTLLQRNSNAAVGFSAPAIDFLSAELSSALAKAQPDLVHLHWVCNDFLSLKDLSRIQSPIVWTLHDSWAFTGGCHVPGDCTSYVESCGRCPILKSEDKYDMSHNIQMLKQETYAKLSLTVIAPSQWMADNARKSSLFRNNRIEVIPNGLDVNIYRPLEPRTARELLGLPTDKPLILFGGMSSTRDPNKGFDLLLKSLSEIDRRNEDIQPELVVFGASGNSQTKQLALPCHFLGTLKDDLSLILAYSAADVMVVPSRQENLVQTAVEAMACGTPVVAFRASGNVDIVDHLKNGYLAEPYDTRDLIAGILWILGNENQSSLVEEARNKAVNTFALEQVVDKYTKLYNELTTVTESRSYKSNISQANDKL